jgi:hypothetical protein
MEINFETVAGFVKILAIVIALFHLLAGLFITRQITRMNRIVKTSNGPFILIVALAYLIVLLVVLLLIISIQV